MPILPESANEIILPKLLPVKQIFPDEHIENIPAAISAQFMSETIRSRFTEGKTAALLVGSRGISNISTIVKATVDALISFGVKPFIVPAMGSHGGGVSEEQVKILDGYGITEATMGVPIKASMETIIIGTIDTGCPVHVDKNAASADYIIPINRIKAHTDFYGEVESGLCKMLSIGIGKHNGCARIHQEGFPNFPMVLPKIASMVMETFCVPVGIGIVENAHEHVHTIRIAPGEQIVQADKELLILSKSLMPRLCFDHLDVLIVERIGKNISGAGLDPNITGRMADQPKSPYYTGPSITRIVCDGLTEETHGNAIGMGCIDFATKEFYDSINFEPTYANLISCCVPFNGKIPMIFKDEDEALLAAIITCVGIEKNDAKVVKIKDTLHLIDIQVSENLLPYCKSNPSFLVK